MATTHLTHLPLVLHICVSELDSIGLGDGLSPVDQVITWTNVYVLIIWRLGTNFSEIKIKIQISPFMKMNLKWRIRNGGNFVQGRKWLEI